MMTPQALAQLRRALTLARNHLAFLERAAAGDDRDTPPWRPLRPTPAMLEEARATVADLEQSLADTTPQLPLFE